MSRKKNKAPKKAKKSSASSSTPRSTAHQGDLALDAVPSHGLNRAALLELASLPYDHRLVLAQDPHVIELAQTLRNLELGLLDRPTNQLFTAQYATQRNIFADLELEPLKNDDTTFNRLTKGSDASDYRYNITKTLPTVIHDFIVAADLNPPSHYKDRKDTLPPAVVKRLAQDNPAPLFELPLPDKRNGVASKTSAHPESFTLELPVTQSQDSESASTTQTASETPKTPQLSSAATSVTTTESSPSMDLQMHSATAQAQDEDLTQLARVSRDTPSQSLSADILLANATPTQVAPEHSELASNTATPPAPAGVSSTHSVSVLSQGDFAVPQVVIPNSCGTGNSQAESTDNEVAVASDVISIAASDARQDVAAPSQLDERFEPQDLAAVTMEVQAEQPPAPATPTSAARLATLPVTQTLLTPRNSPTTPDKLV